MTKLTKSIFIPKEGVFPPVEEVPTEFSIVLGYGIPQTIENIDRLHRAGNIKGISNIIEISNKDQTGKGKWFSAFNLKTNLLIDSKIVETSLESAYQSSKVFSGDKQYIGLALKAPWTAKIEIRTLGAGNVIGFRFTGLIRDIFNTPETNWATEPKDAFYNWLYINSVILNKMNISELLKSDGFTDMLFNSKTGYACQAKACAILVALVRQGLYTEDLINPAIFLERVYGITNETKSHEVYISTYRNPNIIGVEYGCDRRGILGNPFILKDEDDRDSVCEQYREHFDKMMLDKTSKYSIEISKIKEMLLFSSVTLMCWCTPKRCHCETIRTELLK